jgi:hypothetical protein
VPSIDWLLRYNLGGAAAPMANDVLTVLVGYGDGSTEVATAKVTQVVSLATPTAPANNMTINTDTPLFTWTPPSTLPAVFNYQLYVQDQTPASTWNGGMPWNAPAIPSNATSYQYPGTPTFISGHTYGWNIQINDNLGNRSYYHSSFTRM